MIAQLPMCCNANAFALLSSQIPTIDSPDALLQAACAVALHQNPQIDLAQADATLQSYADEIRGRVRGSQPQALLAHLHEFLFEEENFAGNTRTTTTPPTATCPTVLETKLGLPITLEHDLQDGRRAAGLPIAGASACRDISWSASNSTGRPDAGRSLRRRPHDDRRRSPRPHAGNLRPRDRVVR